MEKQWKNNRKGRLNAFSNARGLAEGCRRQEKQWLRGAGVKKNNGKTMEKQWKNNG